MSNKTKRYLLPEEEIPHYWYNIQADMANKPMPPLHPGTKQPLKAEDLFPIFAEELSRQELNQTDAWIEIPEEVREMYKYYRSTPLVRAYGLEKALGTPAHIYFRFSSVRLNRLRNKLLANYLKSGGNELATVRISAFCVAMLSNNSFICKYSIFFRKYELSAAVL